MIIVRDLRLAPGESEKLLKKKAARALRVDVGSLAELRILRKSLDARKKRDIHWLYSVAVEAPGANGEVYVPFRYEIPKAASARRPVVVGFGPAGMFAALALAEAGLRPIVLERGGDIAARQAAVERFRETGVLDPESNVQFGAGGAGAFSDGKLATGTHDGRIAFVLETFRRFGAGESVVYDAKPHVGTDRLVGVVRNLQAHIEALGGELRFRTRFEGFETNKNGLRAVRAAGETLSCRDVVLATGHSARDTFELLRAAGVPMEPKAFAMGVRAEHRQSAVNAAQYGSDRKDLPPADYRCAVQTPDGRRVYTFCMCPGGYVMAGASEAGGVVTNGMSYSGRAGENANAALLVALSPAEFPEGDVLAGMYWQREIERRCFDYAGGGYRAPAQTVGDFLSGRPGAGPGNVAPTYRPGVVWGELREVLPPVLTDALAAAIPELAKRLRHFADPGGVLTAPETRSSSPVRVLRDAETLQSGIPGLYPCGEGAGWAGGITSAAVDGLKCAERIIEKYR